MSTIDASARPAASSFSESVDEDGDADLEVDPVAAVEAVATAV